MFMRVERRRFWERFLTTSKIVRYEHRVILQAVREVGQNRVGLVYGDGKGAPLCGRELTTARTPETPGPSETFCRHCFNQAPVDSEE